MKPKNEFPFLYFSLAYLFSWSFQIPVVLDAQKIIALPVPPQALLLVSIFGPLCAAFYLTYRENGREGVRQLLKRGFEYRFPWYVYLFVAVVPLSITFLAFLATGASAAINTNILSLAGTFVLYFFLGGSFGEEFGWRGFALPRLLQIYNSLTASLVVGVFWSVWHLPLFFLPGTSQFYTPVWLYFIYVTALSFQYTWVFRRTHGSVFACLLLHTFTNITVEIFPIEAAGGVDKRIYYETFFAGAAAVVLVVANFREMVSKPDLPSEKKA